MLRGALIAGLALVLGIPAPVRADFEAPGFELHDVSAWSLRDGELEISPEAIRLGLFDVINVGSYFPLDALGAINADLAITFHQSSYLAIAARAGFLYFDPTFVGVATDFDVLAFPLAFEVSARPVEAVRVHGAIEYLSANPDQQAPDVALRIQRHIGSVGRLALALGGEYRFGRHVGVMTRLEIPLVAHRKNLRWAEEGAGVGEHIRVEVAMHLVWDSINLRLGVGWGPSFLGPSGVFPVLGVALRVF